MHENLDTALSEVLKHEGGFVDHPKDPGGATNRGVTIANFRRYVKPDGTVDDLKKLTEAQARTVFERQYWDAVRGNQLPSGLDFAVFDFAVNSGPSRAVKFLQRLVGAEQDGVIGPETLRAIEAYGDDALLARNLCDMRLDWLKGLKTWSTFGKGWEARVVSVKRVAAAMAAAPPVAPLPTPPVPATPPVIEPTPVPRPSFRTWVIAVLTLIAIIAGIIYWPR